MKVIDVVGAILKKEEKFLIVLRAETRPQPLTWAVPSGKVDPGETINEAIIREVWEETSYKVPIEDLKFIYSKVYDFSKDGYNAHYHGYSIEVPLEFESVVKPDEHTDHRWVTPEECLAMDNLIDGFEDVIKTVFNL